MILPYLAQYREPQAAVEVVLEQIDLTKQFGGSGTLTELEARTYRDAYHTPEPGFEGTDDKWVGAAAPRKRLVDH